MIYQLVSFIIFVCYAILIVAITIGWWRLKAFKCTKQTAGIKVSVVVAMRNEAENVGKLLESLMNQNYDPDNYEVILVDDHSTDQTVLLIGEFIARRKNVGNLRLLTQTANDNTGKKASINRGIIASTGELIVITDADCTAGELWISTIADFYRTNSPQMILGPVRMTDGGTLLGKLQSVEFMSLISSAAGSSNARLPILANGANIAFAREAYESCGGFAENMHYPSGDDMFLLMSIKKKFGAGTIRFLRAEEAIVNTPAIKDLKSFIHQRLRWVSKSKGYTDPFLIAASVIVFLTNAWIVITALLAIVVPGFLLLFLFLLLVKLLVDMPLIYSFSRFQRNLKLIWLFPLTEVLNAVYTLVIGIAGNIVKYEWKGRKLSAN
jgi:cellulose synthase/poly-beta-1,6-N-acetylglucosamine synthase-like glycosyltransferase